MEGAGVTWSHDVPTGFIHVLCSGHSPGRVQLVVLSPGDQFWVDSDQSQHGLADRRRSDSSCYSSLAQRRVSLTLTTSWNVSRFSFML